MDGQDVACHPEEVDGRVERQFGAAVEPQPPQEVENDGLAREDPDGSLVLTGAREEGHRFLAVRVDRVLLAQAGGEDDVCVRLQRVRDDAVVVAGHEEERLLLLARVPAVARLDPVDAHEEHRVRDVGHRDDLGLLDVEQGRPLRERVSLGLQEPLHDLEQSKVALQLLFRCTSRRSNALELGIGGLLGVVCGSGHGGSSVTNLAACARGRLVSKR